METLTGYQKPNVLSEVEKVQNPAFCAFLLWKYGRAYQDSIETTPSNLFLYFLVLPICLHKPTLDQVVSTRISSGLGKFCEKLNGEREELFAIYERALLLRSLTLNAIAFGERANLLGVDFKEGTIRAFNQKGPKIPDRIKPHAKGADKLGSWFAALKPVQIVQALKVEV